MVLYECGGLLAFGPSGCRGGRAARLLHRASVWCTIFIPWGGRAETPLSLCLLLEKCSLLKLKEIHGFFAALQ